MYRLKRNLLRRIFDAERSDRKSALMLSLIAIFAVIGGCNKKTTSSTPPAQTPVRPTTQPTVTLNASPTTVKSRRDRYTFMDVDRCDGFEHRSGHRQGRDARLHSSDADRINHVYDYREWPWRNRDCKRARDSNRRYAAVTAPTRTTPAGINQLFEAEREGCVLRFQ